MHRRATELLESDVISGQHCPAHVTFTPADVTQLTLSQLIGKLTIVNNDGVPDYYGANTPVCQSIFLMSFERCFI